ncbi:hypothetical protein J1792_06665 [Streptomyces triculaminicus]|uniref:Secreted protein n=1 Tax=Streptomyces triculaminicus TaxID=2816232 RepID=A0A939FM44_9ACTN|nr:hypothetical protein [Streptomyces triculaminicus]MBO0652477.1 hypothetical protein [Streptomyces triculaminicus]
MRRKTLARATALCALALSASLTGCGGGERDGYVATGAAGRGAYGPGPVPPKGGVELVPLQDATPTPLPARSPASSSAPANGTNGTSATHSPRPAPANPSGSGGIPPTRPPRPSPLPRDRRPRATPRRPPRRHPSRPSPPPSPSSRPTPAPGPAVLGVSEPRREPADDRWCERVTLTFTNTGGSPVTGGTVTLGTHIVDLFGIDWWTVSSAHALPAPIRPGESVEGTWTVCADAWRVPPGLRVETRDVAVDWV